MLCIYAFTYASLTSSVDSRYNPESNSSYKIKWSQEKFSKLEHLRPGTDLSTNANEASRGRMIMKVLHVGELHKRSTLVCSFCLGLPRSRSCSSLYPASRLHKYLPSCSNYRYPEYPVQLIGNHLHELKRGTVDVEASTRDGLSGRNGRYDINLITVPVHAPGSRPRWPDGAKQSLYVKVWKIIPGRRKLAAVGGIVGRAQALLTRGDRWPRRS